VARRRTAEDRLAALLAEAQTRRGEAESRNEQKTALLAQVAHELRQPLSAITTAARLLDDGDAAPDAKARAAGVIARQTEHLRRLIDDLFDLSRMTRNELRVRKASIDLCEIVADCGQSIEPDATARQIRFSSSVPECPVSIYADGTRVRQIVLNLLTNAVKFTEPGGEIHLAIEQYPSGIVIRVRDTGRGIPAERLATIFEMFHSGGEGRGLGVGLAVVKALTEIHGGTVRASSHGVGHGSEFTVTLPTTIRAIA
jgi:signal transduction histidine kinase